MDACCDGRGEFFDRSENLDQPNQDLPTGQIDCGNIIFSGKCTDLGQGGTGSIFLANVVERIIYDLHVRCHDANKIDLIII